MNRFDVIRVAQLAMERTLPDIFDSRWRHHRGNKEINPVEYAIKMHLRNERHGSVAVIACLALAVAFIGGALQFFGHLNDSARGTFFWIYFTATAVMLLIAAFMYDSTGNAPQGKEVFDPFASDLGYLYSRALGYPATDDIFTGKSDEEIIAQFEDALVECARGRVEAQELAKSGKSEDVRAQAEIEAGELMASFRTTYDTLARFELVSGGYGKYFDKAIARIAEQTAA